VKAYPKVNRLRRLLTVAVLGAVLVVLVVLSGATADWHYVAPNTAGTLLFASAFDGFNDDWQQYNGRLSAAIGDGTLQIDNGETGVYAFSIAKPYVANFDLSAEARAIDGPLNNGYGVIFRYRDPQNFYMFLVSSDGYYRVSRVVDGDQRLLSEWIDTPVIAQGLDTPNRLRVVGRGNRFQFYVNDQLMQVCIPNNPDGVSTYRTGLGCIDGTMQDELVDEGIVEGQVGVVALSIDEPDVVAAFDNVLVYSPDEG
jgi:hypothetical protein